MLGSRGPIGGKVAPKIGYKVEGLGAVAKPKTNLGKMMGHVDAIAQSQQQGADEEMF